MEEETQKNPEPEHLPTLREVLGLTRDPDEEASPPQRGRRGEEAREALEPHWYRVLSAQARARDTNEDEQEQQAPEN